MTTSDTLSQVVGALADPSHRAILARLTRDDGVTAGTEPVAANNPARARRSGRRPDLIQRRLDGDQETRDRWSRWIA